MDHQRDELLKKVVGKKTPRDMWDKLYQLNTFAANLGLLRAASDGYRPKKIVGRSHAIVKVRKQP